MLANKSSRSETTLWIIRWQVFLAKLFHSRLLASICMFYLPLMLVGCALELVYDYVIFSKGVIIALLWMAIAPLLIQNALKAADTFLNKHKHLFRNKKEWEALHCREIKRMQSSEYLRFGLPWGTAATVLLLYSTFSLAPLLIKLWVVASFFALFLVSSIGFYGAYVLITLTNNVCAADLAFNPYHPDKFGGFADFGRFTVKGALYVSTGAMVFPLFFEILGNLSYGSSILYVFPFLLAGIFIFTMIASFILPILRIKEFVDIKKERIILESRNQLDEMIDDFKKASRLNAKQAAEILMHYYFNHSKLLEIKDQPYDFKVLLEFSLSFIVPIGVVLVQVLA